MFEKIRDVRAVANYILLVDFMNGERKYYDVAPLFDRWPAFRELASNDMFKSVRVDVGGYGIVWNEKLDLSCSELWENGFSNYE